MNILFSFGIIGILLYGWMFGWMWKIFSNLTENKGENAVHGRIGQLVMIAFLDFSLSEVMLSTKLGGAVFFILSTLLVVYAFEKNRRPEHCGRRIAG